MREADSTLQAVDSRSGDAIDAAIDELSDVEENVIAMLRRATRALVNAEEENRRLRRAAAKSSVNWYTERQLAERMGVSKDTLARLRKKKLIPCVRITPTVIRYSTIQEAEIAELLEVRGQRSDSRQLREA